RRNVLKLDQVDVRAAAVPGGLEQVDDSEEARAPRQIAGDVLDRDGPDRFDEDVALLHRIDAAGLDSRASPDADGAGDPPVLDALPQALGEEHRGLSRPRPRAAARRRRRPASRPL